MKLVQAYLQPHKLSNVAIELHRIAGVGGMTVYDVRGWGRGRHEAADEKAGQYAGDFEKHVKMEIACADAVADEIVKTIQTAAHTGLRGDGLIVVVPIEDAMRIGTGTRGDEVI